MTDPLIHHPPSITHSDSSCNPKTSCSTQLDETIERCIGDFGWKQFIQASLISMSWAFDAQQTFITVFTDAQPTWHCNTTTTTGTRCNITTNPCFLPKDDASWSWDWPPYTSTVSEWSLQCAGSFISGIPASSFFAGCLAGSFLLATLADSSLGRKMSLVLSCLLMSLSGMLTAASTNIWMYSALRFLCGFGRATVGTSALVLASEIVGKRWRGQVGIVGFFCFTVGFLSLPLIGYLNRGSSWRLVYLWTCVPTMFYSIILHLFVCESPRWLYVQGRKKEFFQTLKSIASTSTTPLLENSNSFFGAEDGMRDQEETVTSNAVINVHSNSATRSNFYSSTMEALWRESWACRRLGAVMAIGFGAGMVYYGMPLGLDSLGFNLYWSVALNALSELPAALITFFLVGSLNRKGLVLGFSMLSGFCSVICAGVMASSSKGQGLKMGLEVASFFSACTAFNVLLIYTLELFPTCVRNSALSMVRQAVVLGGVISPVLVAAGRKNGLLSYGVFGVTIAVSGLFVGGLPETRGGSICDTLEEEKHKQFGAKNINISSTGNISTSQVV